MEAAVCDYSIIRDFQKTHMDPANNKNFLLCTVGKTLMEVSEGSLIITSHKSLLWWTNVLVLAGES